ncbi:hypothetical protein IWX49DRAFT_314091 [Phyllosticta citricarpa]|uniref:Uncharacterized protein n=1 Tax=Phyllosticta paracitricarpa TaxID=2016321 RepID=A0ABR1MUW6_9PEZI
MNGRSLSVFLREQTEPRTLTTRSPFRPEKYISTCGDVGRIDWELLDWNESGRTWQYRFSPSTSAKHIRMSLLDETFEIALRAMMFAPVRCRPGRETLFAGFVTYGLCLVSTQRRVLQETYGYSNDHSQQRRRQERLSKRRYTSSASCSEAHTQVPCACMSQLRGAHDNASSVDAKAKTLVNQPNFSERQKHNADLNPVPWHR